MMQKKWIVLLLACVLALTCTCWALGEQETEGEEISGTLANPWTETDAEGILQTVGVQFGIPEGAENVAYRLLSAESLAEMDFVWNDLEYCARIKPAVAFEDISGLYYDPWDIEEPCEIAGREGVVKRARDGEETVDLCLWFDAVPGLMYSVSTSAMDLDGFDIQAAAEQVFLPLQGDAEGDAAGALTQALQACVGFEGTAGASLKQAAAASELLAFAVDWQAADMDADALADAARAALAALNDDQRGELAEGFAGLCGLVDGAFADIEANASLFEDAGVGERLRALTAESGNAEAWTALKNALATEME